MHENLLTRVQRGGSNIQQEQQWGRHARTCGATKNTNLLSCRGKDGLIAPFLGICWLFFNGYFLAKTSNCSSSSLSPGSDVVDWLHRNVEGFTDRREARKYAGNLLKAGFIRHTVNKVTFSEQCYYVFGDLCGGKDRRAVHRVRNYIFDPLANLADG